MTTPSLRPNADLMWIGVDLDGTLADTRWTEETPGIGDPIIENIDKCYELLAHGYKVIIYTARPWGEYEQIEHWLKRNYVPFSRIICGKPLFRAIVDDKNILIDETSWLP